MRTAWRPALLLAFTVSAANAQSFPSHPVELVVHSTPGGGPDLIARTVAEIISREKLLPQPVVVVNKTGGGGAIAQNYVAQKHGDPHTVLALAATVFLSVPVRSNPELGLEKFQPIALLGVDLNALTVRTDSTYRTAGELIQAAKAKPRSITAGVGSIGATGHYLVWQIERASGARFNVVAIKSGAEAITAVLGGHVQVTPENLSEVMPLVQAKKLRILGTSAMKRLRSLPDVPTLKEQGYDVYVGTGRGFAAPAGIPQEAAKRLEDVFAKVWQTPAWHEFMRKNLYEETYLNAEQFRAYLVSRQGEMATFLGDIGLAKK
jgi:putative tricarboxylic transport membrane protein